MRHHTKLWLLTGAAITVATPALGQESPAAVEEVIVTAQKRSENLQQVPLAITAVTPQAIADAAVVRSRDLINLVPGMVQAVGSGPTQPFLRGIGISTTTPGQDSPVPTYVDDVYLSSPMASTLLLNSIDRLEVLRGPQGTLFGRNAVAGVLSYHTRNPGQSPELSADIGYGSYQTAAAHFYGNTALSSSVAANLSVAYEEQFDGWGDNPTRDEDFRKVRNLAARGKLSWQVDEATNVLLTLWYDKSRSSQNAPAALPGYRGTGGSANTLGPFDTIGEYPAYNWNEGGGAALRFETDLGWATLVDVLSYQAVRPGYLADADGSPNRLQTVDITWSDLAKTNEIQLVSPGDQRLKWTVGFFVLDDNIRYTSVVQGQAIPAGSVTGTRLTSRSWAPFAQATFDLNNTTRLTGGLRYSVDKRHFSGQVGNNAVAALATVNSRQKYTSTTFRAALDHDFSDDTLGYVSFNRGYKAGTYNVAAVNVPPRQLRPERLDSYEAGLKNRLFDRRLILNFAGFYYDYTNITVRSAVANAATTFDLVNAATARIYGLDVDMTAQVTPDFSLSGGLEVLHAEFTRFPITTSLIPAPAGGNRQTTVVATGNTLPNAPKFSANLGGSYRLPFDARHGELKVSANVVYRSKIFFEADNTREQTRYALLNAALAWTSPDNDWSVKVWARNLGDTRYKLSRFATAFTDLSVFGEPRSVGVTLGYQLGGH